MTMQIEFSPLSEINLDPMNPRLGRSAHSESLSQEQVLDRMKDWSLEELATSFLESGFWPQEAVLCALEEIDGREQLVVIEGNRRIAALKRLERAFAGEDKSRKWQELVAGQAKPDDLFAKVPFLRLKERSEVDAFLGFRHVTGIKEWAPPEKAQFIAKMIDEKGLSYRQVMRKIGSKTPVVERNYVAFSILKQMEEVDDLEVEDVERRFSVLFLSLREKGVQNFLGVADKFGIEPQKVNPPVPEEKVQNLRDYSRWLFGDAEHSPIVTDSRLVGNFSKVLASTEGLEYLRSVRRPSLEKAFVISGGDQEEVYELISTAAYNVEESLSSIHHYKDDEKLQGIVKRLIVNVDELKSRFGF